MGSFPEAQPGARANGPERPWLILNVGQRNSMRIQWVVLLLLPLCGCNWSEPLLPEPNAAVEPRLLGEWQAVGDRVSSLSISSVGSRRYSIVLKGPPGRAQTQFSFR